MSDVIDNQTYRAYCPNFKPIKAVTRPIHRCGRCEFKQWVDTPG